MSMANWGVIVDKMSRIDVLAHSKDWHEVSVLVDEIEKDLYMFFESKVSLLSLEEQAQVKEEGEMLLARISFVVTEAKNEKKTINESAKKLAQGKKGISAYKQN